MKLLAIDTSCDESCAAIFDTHDWKLLADVVTSHVKEMAQYGGVVPEIASREHLKALPLAVNRALSDAHLTLNDIDWFSATSRPGLIGALLVGVSYVKGLAYATEKPFSLLDHLEAHLFSPLLGELDGEKVPPFPWIALVVSGGHTELFEVRGVESVEWLGGTLDDAAGEAFDKIGKLLGFSYPAGPAIDRWVKSAATPADRTKYKFPIAKTEGLHFSFSGLKTAVNLETKALHDRMTEFEKLSLVASAQESILAALVSKVQMAQEARGIEQVVVTGGVACNSRLRELLPNAYFPKPRHCTDNAAMVAILSALKVRSSLLKKSHFDETAEPCIPRNF